MKKTFYNLIIFAALVMGAMPNQAYGQCTDFAAGPFTNLDVTFGGAPCDDGTGCPFLEFTGFEVFASESYILSGFIAGGEYSFSICNGPGAGSWVPDFTIQAPSGAIDAFGPGDGDGCTITWTASEDGTYFIIINEADQCGGGPNVSTDNGLPAITCNGVACPAADVCSAGTLTSVEDVSICGTTETFDFTVENDTIPNGGVYTIIGFDNLGGTGGNIANGAFVTLAATTSTFNSDLNGFFSGNNAPPLGGIWVFRGGATDATGNVCSITTDSLIVNFGQVIESITRTGADELTVNVSGGVEPYTYLWDDANAQTTVTAVGLDTTQTFTVFVTDATGCVVSGEFEFNIPPPTPEICNAGTLTTIGEVAICDIAETFDLTIVNDTLPMGGSNAMVLFNVLGGTGGTDADLGLLLPANSITLDAGFNGFFAQNNLPPLSGPWVFMGAAADAAGMICSLTTDSLIVNFGTESPTIVDIVSNGIDELTANATGGVLPYEYLWSDGQTTQTATSLEPGMFSVTVVDANGCLVVGESSFTVSTNSIASLNAHSIMPNPNNGSFTVQLTFDNSQFVEVEILDIMGKMVQKENGEMTSGHFDFEMNEAAAGIYFVKITAGNESMTQRIVVGK